MKTLLISAFSLLSVFGFALNASEAQACGYSNSEYHCHWKHGQRYCHGNRPVSWYGPSSRRFPVYFVAGQAPTPQCHWYLGRQYCSAY